MKIPISHSSDPDLQKVSQVLLRAAENARKLVRNWFCASQQMRQPSKILDAVHQTATGLHKSGTITDITMREFDKLYLHPVHALQPKEVNKIARKGQVVSR